MNFEQTYIKYLDGTATEEEKTFVENEIKKCNDLFAVIERQANPRLTPLPWRTKR